jgi:hypothetical protein
VLWGSVLIRQTLTFENGASDVSCLKVTNIFHGRCVMYLSGRGILHSASRSFMAAEPYVGLHIAYSLVPRCRVLLEKLIVRSAS